MTMTSASDPRAQDKQAAAVRAVELVRSGMRVGLGSGSTAIYATRRIAERLRAGDLVNITAFPSSNSTAQEAIRLGIPMLPDELPVNLDLTIDGADEVDPDLNLIKGGGGSLLREKILAQASAREIIVVDETKLSPQLGTNWPVPVEVLPFGWQSQARYIETLGASWAVRSSPDGTPFITDSGNLILDCRFGLIADARHLAAMLNQRAGITEHGLFIGLATDLIVAGPGGIEHRQR